MQTSQAVSAGGFFTSGGTELSSPDTAPAPTQLATITFELHLQQSGDVPAGRAGIPLLPSTGGASATVVALNLSAQVRVVPPVTTTEVATTEDVLLIPLSPLDLIPPELSRAPALVPAELVVSDASAGADEERPLVGKEPTDSDRDAVTLPPAEVMAVAAAAMVAPPRPPEPRVRSEAVPMREGHGSGGAVVAGGDRGSEPPRAASAVFGRVSPGVPARLDAPAVVASNAAPDAAPEAAANVRRSNESEAKRAIDAIRPLRSFPEMMATTTTPAPLGAPRGAVDRPDVRVPVAEIQQAPVRSNSPGWEPKPTADASEIERTSIIGRPGRESDPQRAIEVSRLQTGAGEIPVLNAAMFRRANVLSLAGTAAAKSDRDMDKGLELNQTAGLPEQKLPAHGRTSLSTPVRPSGGPAVELVRAPGIERPDDGLHSLAESLAGRPSRMNGVASPGMLGMVEAAGSSNPTRTVEQLQQNLTREVAQFKRFNAESMAVVLKPDAQTEIFLHLASRNGQIEIQARFERGDFASLNGQWAQLQQTLSQQGVRLSQLQEGFNPPPSPSGASADWGHGQMNQGHQRQAGRNGEDSPHKQFFEEYLPPGTAAETPRRSGRMPSPAHQATSVLEAWA